VRIQGLRGRYTQILSDGLPLYGGQTGALGLLQIPPMDLGQVEVIKGVASALYGASALGGVVNLISRRPSEEPEHEILFNQTTLGGTDAVLWSDRQLSERWGYTLLASGHRQATADVDDDGWADLPSFRRGVIRPRLFWSDGEGRSLFLTAGGMIEDREGGTVGNATTPNGTSIIEGLGSRRLDAGAALRFLLSEGSLLSVRGSAVRQRHEHAFASVPLDDVHTTAMLEASLSGTAGRHLWVIGAALQREDYSARELQDFDYAFTVPGVFMQDELTPAEWITLAASARLDVHSEYGSFLNPRVSALLRPVEGWSLRASAGSGYFAPTPWTEETEAIGLVTLLPLGGLEAEKARSGSLDVARVLGPFELNATVFASRIERPVQLRQAGDVVLALANASAPVRTWGTELSARYHAGPLHVTATHVYMRSTEPDPEGGARRKVPLTPEHSAGVVAAFEQEGKGRVGLELYYTGRQPLEWNPYRDVSEPYLVLGFLVERRFGPARFFLNAENVLDARQTRHDPLPLPYRGPDGRWITDVWGPLEGRSFNAGVRWAF
jgi:iron complex outermembrane receptor protein